MPVDSQKPRKILVVHGVQSGTDEDENQHELIRQLLQTRLGGVQSLFETEMYRYENINAAAQQPLEDLLTLFLDQVNVNTLFAETQRRKIQ